MKWSLDQLMKLTSFPAHFTAKIVFSDEDITKTSTIMAISPVDLNYTINRINFETYLFNYHIKADVTLECALTLEPVVYLLDIQVSETYGTEETEDIIKIEKQTIDLEKVLWSLIIVSIPIRVVRDDAYEILKERNISLEEEFPDNDES